MGGVAWDYLNVVLGLKQLGHDVFYIEDSGEWAYLDGGPSDEPFPAFEASAHVQYLSNTFESFGLGNRWAYHFPLTGEWFGLAAELRADVIASADVLLNVSGTVDYPDKYSSIRKLVYIDTDPVFTQIALKNGGDLLARRGVSGLRVCEPGGEPDDSLLSGWTREEKLRRRVDLHDIHFTVGETIHRSFGENA